MNDVIGQADLAVTALVTGVPSESTLLTYDPQRDRPLQAPR